MSSLITVVKDNNESLKILLDAIALGTSIPKEVVVIDLHGNADIPQSYNFMVKVQKLTKHERPLNKSAARNLGARKAWDENLIFMDVDCIPNVHFVEKMEDHLLYASGLFMGEPRMLKSPLRDFDGDTELFAQSTYHDDRPDLKKELTLCFDPNLFWAKAFGLKKKVFEQLNGFDESYSDADAIAEVDFVYKLFKNKLDFYLTVNTFYHSPKIRPDREITELKKTIAHCNYFFKKWGAWPLKDSPFSLGQQGFIHWSEIQTNEIEMQVNLFQNQPINKPKEVECLSVATEDTL